MAKFRPKFMNAAEAASQAALRNRRSAIELGLSSSSIKTRMQQAKDQLDLATFSQRRLDIATEPPEARRERIRALHEKALVNRQRVESQERERLKQERLSKIKERGERQRAARPAKVQARKQKKQERVPKRLYARSAPKIGTHDVDDSLSLPAITPPHSISTSVSTKPREFLPISPLAAKMAIGAAALGVIGASRLNGPVNIGQQPQGNDQLRDYLQQDG
jgi:hypothetical protein